MFGSPLPAVVRRYTTEFEACMTEPILPLGAVSRRDFMATVGVIGAAWFAAAACASDATPADTPVAMPKMAGDTPAPAQTLIHFTPAQAAEIDAISSRIIPTDAAPGAHEAGVLYFIDRSMTTFAKDQVPLFEAGLASVSKAVEKAHGASAKFSTLTTDQQDAVLRSIEKTPFFGAIRFATIAGYLALPKYGGNKDYVGWKFIGQEHAFEQKPPFGWYDRPENQMALLGRVL
jgi:gluconate 2-dehydrogenase gamma chain